MRLFLGDLAFEAGAGAATYTVADISGLAGVGVKRATVDRESAHGSFTAPGFVEAREISWRGLIETSSPDDQDEAIRELAAYQGLDGPVHFSAQGVRTYWALVERASIPDPKVLVYGQLASYEVRVVVPGGFLFGETHRFEGSGAVKVFHHGTAPAVPEIAVTGSMPSGYEVKGPAGERFVVSAGLASGVTDRLDLTNGWLFRDGVLTQGAVSRAQTFTIPDGIDSKVTLTPGSGSGSLGIDVTDTFS